MEKKKLYIAAKFGFDNNPETFKEKASKDVRARLIGIDNFIRGHGETIINNRLSYVGPYYFFDGFELNSKVVSTELSAINQATDCIFIIKNEDCSGVITELLISLQMKKRMHIFYLDESHDKDRTGNVFHNPCWYPLTYARTTGENVSFHPFSADDNIAVIVYDYIQGL